MISKALVLAAGNGTRLIDSNPKPLYNLLGLPLLVRTLLALEKAQITEAYIVLGYEADKVRTAIEAQQPFKINLHWLKNEEWQKPNGLSVLTAKDVLQEPFILTMCDHIFDPEIVKNLRNGTSSSQGIKLVVDYDLENVFDLDDATKLEVNNGRVGKISKSLLEYNAVDTGFFRATPDLFSAIEKSSHEGRYSLSDGVQMLADQGLVEAVDIQDHMWQDIDTLQQAKEGEKKLLASLGKSDDGLISRKLNRPVSKAASRLLAKTRVTPNQVTFFNMLLGLASGVVASLGGYLPFLTSAVLIQLNSIFDGTDGELARLKFQSSQRGQWFDTFADNVVYVAYLLGITMGVKNSGLPVTFWYTGLAGVLFAVASPLSLYYHLAKNKKSGSLLEIKYGFEGWHNRIKQIIYFIGKRDTWAVSVFLLALAGIIHFFIIFISLFLFVTFLLSLRINIKFPQSPSPKKSAVSVPAD